MSGLPLPLEILAWIGVVVFGAPVALVCLTLVELVMGLLGRAVIGMASAVSPAFRARRRKAKRLAATLTAMEDYRRALTRPAHRR